jgi:hypothetical protein
LHAAAPLPLVGAAHLFAQAPQLSASFCSSTHAVGATVGQAEKVWLHVKPHALFEHAGWPLVTPPHALPQVWQFFGSSVRLVQLLEQRSGVGALQLLMQPMPPPGALPHLEAVPPQTVVQLPQ